MKHSLPTFATIAVLGALAARSDGAPAGALLAALAALCVFAVLARVRANLALAGAHAPRAELAERRTTIAMLVSSSVVLFCCATAIGWSGRLDLVAAVPVVVALFGAVVHDARVQAVPGVSNATRGVPLVPLCGLLLLTVAWIVDGRLGFDRRLESARAAATLSTRN